MAVSRAPAKYRPPRSRTMIAGRDDGVAYRDRISVCAPATVLSGAAAVPAARSSPEGETKISTAVVEVPALIGASSVLAGAAAPPSVAAGRLAAVPAAGGDDRNCGPSHWSSRRPW